eukprot:superscaffoldBa00004599_g19154
MKTESAVCQSNVDPSEQQRRLAAKRESLLTSLRGLLKAKRGVKRREATKSTQNAGDAAKNEIRKAGSQKMSLKESTKMIGRKTDVRVFMGKRATVERREETTVKLKEAAENKTVKTAEVKKTDRADQINTTTAASRTADEVKTKESEEKKDERKIIGKIVKATAGQGAKVQESEWV